jgi:hypothetical protein
MLGPAVIRAAELLVVVLAAGTVTLAAGLWWLRRRVRRLKLLGRVAAARAGTATAGAVAAGWHRAWSLPFPDRRCLAAVRERRRLWQAVGAAERAVTAARRVGAPTGDLDGLCRCLREAAGNASRGLPLSPQPAADIRDLVQAAGQVRMAAASAAAAMARPAARRLAEDAHREAQALAAGIAAADLGGDRR